MNKESLVGAFLILVSLSILSSVPSHAASKNERYIVQFGPGKAIKGKSALKAAGAIIKLNLDRYDAVAAEIPAGQLANLKSNPNVQLIEPDVLRYPISMVRSAPSGADRTADDHVNAAEVVPYGVAMVQAEAYEGNPASGIQVCVIDSGYDLGHEDKPGEDVVTGTDDLAGSGFWSKDGSGHGTHVSGTINALDNELGVVGVFPSVPMHIVRVFGDSGAWAYSSTLVGAVDDCLSHGAKVINMSLGGPLPSRLENAVFLHAQKAGVLSVAAAGNGGDGRSCDLFADPAHPERQACKMHYPSGYDSVLSVAAVDAHANIADFSQINSKVEIAAPGVSVLSTVPTGSLMDVRLNSGLGQTVVVPMDNFTIPAAPVSGKLQDCGLGTLTADCGSAADKVCLIERGVVSFATKALACQDAGGIAAVIFQKEGETGPVLGTLGTTLVDIPVVGVERQTGLALRGAFIDTDVTLSFNPTHYDYDYFSGTSMATPHVSGVAALIWSTHTQCGPLDIRRAINATAIDLGATGRDKYFGNGLVQAQEASNYLDQHPCPGN